MIPLLVVALFLSTPDNRTQTLQHAAALIQQQHWGDAESLLQPLAQSTPADPVALNLLGYVEMRKGEDDKAERLFTEAIATGHRIPGPYINLAVLYGLRKPLDALSELKQALVIDPAQQQALELVRDISKQAALNALRSGDKDAALAVALRARDISPNDAEVQYELGMVAFETGLYPDAESALREAIRLSPQHGQAHYALARVYLKESHAQEAEDEMRTYLKLNPKDASAEYGLGYILVAEQRLDEAKAAFEKSLQLQPSQTESVFQLGEIAIEQGDMKTADAQYARVLNADPNHAGALTGRGVVAFRSGRIEEAQKRLTQAIAAAPDYGKAHYYYALALTKAGDHDAAKREFEIAKKLQEKTLTQVHLAP